MIKNSLFTLLLSLFFVAAQAQDIIVKKNGKTVEGKVTEVGVDRITYKINNTENSANFVILKREVLRIEFENGQTVFMTDRIDGGRAKTVIERESEAFGANLINISPFKALDSGPGFGISYERIVDKKGYFGIILPFTITIPGSSTYIFDVPDNNGSAMFYLSPGLKIYPFGQRKVTYAVGPSFFFGRGERWNNTNTYDPVTGGFISTGRNNDWVRMGLLVNNYVNFQVTPKFQISLNGGLGSRYVDREKYMSRTTITRGLQVTGEFNFSLGFRF
ncbi:hypothetical protein [Dyadobacter crusticola]|uniref:hypothetical protein n=1 Tax=Dyadobacter crusticola TaxID=292407 RepID=UPI0004E15DBE|nr:hypothetical protein [Dyadobacter crusticola]